MQTLLSQMAFPHSCQIMKGHVEPVNGISKDVYGAKLLPTTVSAYPAD